MVASLALGDACSTDSTILKTQTHRTTASGGSGAGVTASSSTSGGPPPVCINLNDAGAVPLYYLAFTAGTGAYSLITEIFDVSVTFPAPTCF